MVEESLDSLNVERQVFDTNFMGTIAMTKAVLSQMIPKKEGRIVNINSISGYIGTPMRASYAASKFAMSGYFESLKAEVHSHNIHITNIFPGHVRTNISANAATETGKNFGKVDPNIGEGFDPADLARAILCAVYNKSGDVYFCSWKHYLGTLVKAYFPLAMPMVLRNHLKSQIRARDAAK